MFKYTVYIFTCITIKGYNTLLSMGFYDTNTNVIFHKTLRGDRDSHSVLGSIFLNPSVAAGVSYGSGGTQIRKAWDGGEPPIPGCGKEALQGKICWMFIPLRYCQSLQLHGNGEYQPICCKNLSFHFQHICGP